MPRLTGQTTDADMEVQLIGGSGFDFSGTRIDHLPDLEYTAVTVAIDETGSVTRFAQQLREMLITSIDACKQGPRSDNILARVLTFNSTYPHGVSEIHGFKLIADINTADYPEIHPKGGTPLFDAVYSAVGATNTYAKPLHDKDYTINAIYFIVTDGENTSSVATPAMIKQEIEKSLQGEELESVISVLIGINTAQCRQSLEEFQREAGLTHFIDAPDASPSTLAKIANFIIQSVSSQSQSIGTGSPSQNIPVKI